MSMAQFLLASRKEAVFIRDDNFIQVGGVGMHIDVYLAARAVLRGIPGLQSLFSLWDTS